MALSSIESRINKLHSIEVKILPEATIDNNVFIKSSINKMFTISSVIVEEKSSPIKKATLESFIKVKNPIISSVDNN